jgi:hypothetical protein
MEERKMTEPRSREEIQEAILTIREAMVKDKPIPVFVVFPTILDALHELLERKAKEHWLQKGEAAKESLQQAEVLPKPDTVFALLEGVAYDIDVVEVNVIRLTRSTTYN